MTEFRVTRFNSFPPSAHNGYYISGEDIWEALQKIPAILGNKVRVEIWDGGPDHKTFLGTYDRPGHDWWWRQVSRCPDWNPALV